MKHNIIFAVLIIGINARIHIDQWTEFKINHNKVYTSIEEEVSRFEIFKKNLKLIEEHNTKYDRRETTYYKGVNKFTDMTEEELRERYLTKVYPPTERRESSIRISEDVPESWNWTEQGVVTDIKDQQSCGCCYAFASVAAIESGNAIVNKKLINLSVQQLMDCSYGDIYLNYGCSGGIIEGSIHYVMDHGIESQESYPYLSKLQNCSANSSLNVVSVKDYKNVPEDENLLKAAVGHGSFGDYLQEIGKTIENTCMYCNEADSSEHTVFTCRKWITKRPEIEGTIGPVAAAIDSSKMFSYAGGIMEGSCNALKLTNHVILIVGYGTEDGVDYWYIKNSWGPSWGLNGYGKVQRNAGNTFCISTYTAYPIMS